MSADLPTAIRISIGSRRIAGTLHSNATAQDLVALLPLTVELSDFHGQEKLAPLPRALSTRGAPGSSGASAGVIGYYAPSHDLVLYYAQVGTFPGITPIGRYAAEAIDAIRDLPDGAEATVSLG